MLKLTANRETLIRRASEQAEFARTVHIGQLYITNESVMDGKQYSGPRDSRNSRRQAILNDHVKIGPVTGIDVFESAGTLVFKSTSTVTTI